MLIWYLKLGERKNIWGLKCRGPKHTHLRSDILGKRDYLVSQNAFYLNNIYLQFTKALYCLTKISIRAKRSISRVFSLFIVPSPFFCTLP